MQYSCTVLQYNRGSGCGCSVCRSLLFLHLLNFISFQPVGNGLRPAWKEVLKTKGGFCSPTWITLVSCTSSPLPLAVARGDVSSNLCVGVGATHVDIFLRALPHAVPGRRGSKMTTKWRPIPPQQQVLPPYGVREATTWRRPCLPPHYNPATTIGPLRGCNQHAHHGHGQTTLPPRPSPHHRGRREPILERGKRSEKD